jgi:hypothetical protein
MMCQWASYNVNEEWSRIRPDSLVRDPDPHQNVTDPPTLLINQSLYKGSRAEGRPGEPGPGDERPEGGTGEPAQGRQ